MKHLTTFCLAVIAMLIMVINLFAQTPDTLWTKTYGGTGQDRGEAVQQTYDGGYIITGWTRSFGAGAIDVYLIKTDSLGNNLWTKTFGGVNNEKCYIVRQTADSGYILTGWTDSFGAAGRNVYLIKTYANGDTTWTRTYGGSNHDYGRSVRQTLDGRYIIAGYTQSFGAGQYDVYLIRTDASGYTLWTKTYGGINTDYGYSVQQTLDGGYIITGFTQSYGAGGSDVYLIKTYANGDTMWTKTYGGTDSDVGYSIQQTSDGGYIIAGYTQSFGSGQYDVYLIKTYVNGDTTWTKTYGGTGDDYGTSVKETSDGGFIIAGSTESFGVDSFDIYLIKTDSLGNILWTKTLGGVNNDESYSVQETFDSGYIIAGYTGSFGAGNYDVYLIKTEPDVGIEETKSSPIISFICMSEPNPFKNRIQIKYALPQSSMVNIVIYNLLGQEIKTLVNRKENEGTHTITWDGDDNSDNKVPGGIYFLKLKTGKYNITRKLLKLK